MARWICSDGEHSMEIEADSEREAAEDYIRDIDINEGLTTTWTTVYVRRAGSREYDWSKTIAIHPIVPICSSESGHSWVNPIELVGGLKENPGVYGHGGGVVIHTVCEHCGTLRVVAQRVQDPCTGQQGLELVGYEIGKYKDWAQRADNRDGNGHQ